MKSAKEEILKSLTELKEKGVQVKFNDSCLQRNIPNSLTFASGSAIYSTNVMIAPKDIVIEIHANSTEDEIMNKIIWAKDQISFYEKNAQISAIVEFLKGELN